jgi:hypothetical protein
VPRQRKYSQRSLGSLRAFSISYGEPTGEYDRRGRPLTRSVRVNIEEDDKQGALDELARQLRSRKSLSNALRDWLAYAIEHRSEFPSLDHALGLRSMSGSKRKPATKDELMRGVLIFHLRELREGSARFSWVEVADVFGDDVSADSVRGFYDRISPDLTRDGFALKVPGRSTGISRAQWSVYRSPYNAEIEKIERQKATGKRFRRSR